MPKLQGYSWHSKSFIHTEPYIYHEELIEIVNRFEKVTCVVFERNIINIEFGAKK